MPTIAEMAAKEEAEDKAKEFIRAEDSRKGQNAFLAGVIIFIATIAILITCYDEIGIIVRALISAFPWLAGIAAVAFGTYCYFEKPYGEEVKRAR